MKLRSIFGLSSLAFCLISPLAMAKPLELFGAPLANATRSTLEPALQRAGLTPVQVGPKWWFDIYRVHGQLPGASKLLVGYTEHGHFAMAQYVFPSFMNTQLVEKVIHMVTDQYGAPSRSSGNPGLGGVTAVWNEGNGMEIRVTRGWPSTTTYLTLENVANRQRMRAEMHQQRAEQQKAQAKAHANAF